MNVLRMDTSPLLFGLMVAYTVWKVINYYSPQARKARQEEAAAAKPDSGWQVVTLFILLGVLAGILLLFAALGYMR